MIHKSYAKWLGAILAQLLILLAVSGISHSQSLQPGRTIDVQVNESNGDSEEPLSNGQPYIDSSDLELGDDADYVGKQIVGLRFSNIGLPPNTIITKAWIQFTAKTADDGAARLSISAELAPLSSPFGSRSFDISHRRTTAGAISWIPGPWSAPGDASIEQRTPDLSALLQELVTQPDWSARSPITFMIKGTGRRNAASFDGNANEAPRLHVEYANATSNAPPVALPDSVETSEQTPVIINVIANDKDSDGNSLTLAGTGLPAHGTASASSDGNITYRPRKWFSGTDTFSYTIIDRQGGVATSAVTVRVNPSPSAVDDVATTAAGTPATIDVISNDSDPGGSALSISEITQPARGAAQLSADGTVSYQPASGFTGTDVFRYTVRNTKGQHSTASATIHVGTGFGRVQFAVIGDFGTGNEDARKVADLVKMRGPEFIVTVGDNVYGQGMSPDRAVGQFYSSFIGNYLGLHGRGSDTNRFFPSLGNHDWRDLGLDAYLDYFDFPRSTSGNRRYYDFIRGPVHFFVIDSDELEPDGVTANSTQAQWLQSQLQKSITPWQVVVMHEPPHSSGGEYGGAEMLQWPFESWGADAVLTGHEHIYERIMRDDNKDGRSIPYFVNGVGGAELYAFKPDTESGSAFRAAEFGAMNVIATDEALQFEFWSISGGGTLLDEHRIMRNF